MKISLNWMKRIVDFPLVFPEGGPTAEELAACLTRDGLDVERIVTLPAGWNGLSREDSVLEVRIPRNRVDLLSQIWPAKEMCGLYRKSFKEFVTYILRSPSSDWMPNELPDTELRVYSDTANCKMLCGRLLGGVQAGALPTDMLDELIANELFPCGDVSDYTRYFMRYFGQPLFALDADTLPSRTIRVVDADSDGLLTSRGKTYRYTSGDPLITCEGSVLSIGGLLFDDRYLAGPNTRSVILLSYVFDRDVARALSRRYDLSDLCSVIMSTGGSPQDAVRAAMTCTALLYDLGTVERIEAQDIFNRFDMGRKTLMYTLDEINGLLGTKLRFDEFQTILCNPELNTAMDRSGNIVTSFPSYRQDNTVNDIAQSILCYLGCEILERTEAAE